MDCHERLRKSMTRMRFVRVIASFVARAGGLCVDLSLDSTSSLRMDPSLNLWLTLTTRMMETRTKDRNRFYNYKSIPNRYKPIMKPILTILTGLHLIFSKFETKGRFLNIRHKQLTYKWHIRDIGILTRSHQLQTFTKPIKINRFALTGYMLRISKMCQWELDLLSCEIGYCTCQK